jgi:tRNA nucleotidyltransferase (CCA-adding enzyme)
VIARLKLPRLLVDTALAARRLRQDLPSLAGEAPSKIAARLDDVPPLAIYASFLATDAEDLQSILENYLTEWRHVSASIDGHDLQARGLPPGPIYRLILESLRDAWLDGKVTTKEEEAALLEDLIEKYSKQQPEGR